MTNNQHRHHDHGDTTVLDRPAPTVQSVETILTYDDDGAGCYDHDGQVFSNKDEIGILDSVYAKFGGEPPKKFRVTFTPIR